MEHGDYSISLDGNMIIVRVSGGFNEYGVRKLKNEIESIVKHLKDGRFSLLFNYLEVEGGTPEAFLELNKASLWLNAQNLIAFATVSKSRYHMDLLKQKVPDRKSNAITNFDNEVDAVNWLKKQS